jgi:hypothetical protein
VPGRKQKRLARDELRTKSLPFPGSGNALRYAEDGDIWQVMAVSLSGRRLPLTKVRTASHAGVGAFCSINFSAFSSAQKSPGILVCIEV